ncbi:hypothetical protein PMAYCL1PPCAC_10597, partial [Pristionchus mayeri]
IITLLLLDVVAAAAPSASQRLPFLPAVFKHSSSFLNESSAAEALGRFHSIVKGKVDLNRHKNLLKAITTVKSVKHRLLYRPSSGQADLIDQLATPLKNVVVDRPSVADINKPIAQYLYGGDVMLSEGDLEKMGAEANLPILPDGFRTKRGAPVVTSRRWPLSQPIAFIFNSDIDEKTRQVIRTATQKIQANTCLSFQENGNVGTQLQFHRGGGCWSYIGNTGAAKQLISIDNGCGIVATVSHEISHALGVDHTQNRKDRDAYVSVNYGAVNADVQHNFAKLSDAQNNNFGVPYDYGSVMHYGANDFSNNCQPVLVTSQAEYLNTMGQRKYEAFNDYKMINKLYNCSSNCNNAGLVCQNGGYPSPRLCNVCVCSDFFTGTTCQTPRGTVNIADSAPFFTTTYHQDYNQPLYASGNEYNWDMFGKDAVKIIRAPVGRRMKVTLNRVYGGFGQLPCYLGCPFYGIEIIDNSAGDLTTVGKNFCCGSDENKSFVSQTNVVGY